jgi:hypothetical protein
MEESTWGRRLQAVDRKTANLYPRRLTSAIFQRARKTDPPALSSASQL